MNFLKVHWFRVLALTLIVGGLFAQSGAASSLAQLASPVTVNMPAAKSLNLYVSGREAPSGASGEDALGGLVHNIQESFDAGIAVNGTEVITSTGTLKLGSGTAIDKHLRTTTTVNPQPMGAGQSTTTVLTLTGASTSDHCLVNATSGDLLSTTSTAILACRITSADTATVYYYNATSTAAFDAGSSVLSVQAWSY